MEFEDIDHGGRSAEISYGFIGQGSSMKLPSGGMPGPSGNKDGDVGSLPLLACTENCGHSGGGKSTLSTVHSMRLAVPLVGTEQQAPWHRSVRQGRGAK